MKKNEGTKVDGTGGVQVDRPVVRPNKMPYELRERCLFLRCKSKRGERMYPEEEAVLRQCFADYRDDYCAMGDEVFELTKPFGA